MQWLCRSSYYLCCNTLTVGQQLAQSTLHVCWAVLPLHCTLLHSSVLSQQCSKALATNFALVMNTITAYLIVRMHLIVVEESQKCLFQQATGGGGILNTHTHIHMPQSHTHTNNTKRMTVPTIFICVFNHFHFNWIWFPSQFCSQITHSD